MEHSVGGLFVWRRMVEFLRHAFAIEYEGLTEEDERLLEKIVDWLTKRGFASPALLFGEVGMPLTFLGSQILLFLKPFAEVVFNPEQYQRVIRLLENREAVRRLLDLLEERIRGKRD